MTHDADFLVIGSGFGGAVSALRLAQKGYRVVVLERGRRFSPAELPRTSRELRRYLWAPAVGCHGIQAITPLRHVLVLHGTGVGGGSLVYANVLIEPDAAVFDDPAWGEGDMRDRLRPHYDEARRMLGATRCQGVGHTDTLLRDVVRDMVGADTHRVHDVGVWFGPAGEEVADPFFDGEGPSRVGCTRCGACMVGCRVGAKNTLDKNYLWMAEQIGARIVPETRATSLRREGDGWAVETRPTGGRAAPRIWRAREVVLAAGVLGTVDLLLRSREAGHLPGLSGQVGHRVRTNSESILVADGPRADDAFGDHVAITSGVQLDEHTHLEMVRLNAGSDVLFWLSLPLQRAGETLPRFLGALRALLTRPRQLLAALWPFGRAARSGIVLAMQTTEGHMTLERQRRWWRGGGRTLVSSLPPGQTPPVADIPAAQEVTRRLARKMGGHTWRSLPEATVGAPTTAHILGGCGMAPDPEHGVVDFAGRVHGCPGLRIADGSVVPVNLGVNPSLTITALAEHIMAQVPERAAAD